MNCINVTSETLKFLQINLIYYEIIAFFEKNKSQQMTFN